MRFLAGSTVVLLAFASVRPASAAPHLVDERLMCVIAEVAGPPAKPERIRVSCGKRHGAYAGGRGEIYGRTKDGGITVVGRAETVEPRDGDSWLRVVPEAGSRPEAIDTKGVVELRVLLPSEVRRGLLMSIYQDGIVLLDNQRKPLVTLDELVAARDDALENRALDAMIVAGHEVVEFTEELKQVVSHGKYKGQVCKQILTASTRDDYRDFLRFVRDYPGKYIGHDWKISEVYATWIINDMPLSVEALVAEVEGLGLTPALDARAAEMKPGDVQSAFERMRREISDWPMTQRAESEKRVAVMERIFAARKAPPAVLLAELEHARARTLAKTPKKLLETAAVYGRAAAAYARVLPAEMREAPLERIVCMNNQASYYDDAGKPDEALKIIPAIRALVASTIATAPDAEIAAHAGLSEAFTIGLGARIANERGDYKRVVSEITPTLDRYSAVGAPGFRAKEIELIQFVVKAHTKLGEVDAAAKLLERAALRASELGDGTKQAEIAWAIGDLHYDSERYTEAVADYDRTAELARGAGDKAWIAKALAAAGQALWVMGRPTEALARHAEAMKVREETGDESGIAWQLQQVGKIRVELGDRAAARRDFERSLELDKKRGDKREEAAVHRELGQLYRALSEPEAMEREYAAARAIFESLGMKPDAAWAALGQGRARAMVRDFAGALVQANAAVKIGDATGDRELRVRARIGRAAWLREDGKRAEARTSLEEALAAAGDDVGLKIDTLVDRIGQRTDEGELTGAEADCREALKLADTSKDAARRISVMQTRANILQVKGDYEGSIKLLDQVVALAKSSGNRPAEGGALQKKAWQLGNLGRLREARTVADEALAIAIKNADDVERAWVYNVLARIAGDMADVREELRLYDEGIPLMKKAGLNYGEAALIFNRAIITARLRDFAEAERAMSEAARIAGNSATIEFDLALGGQRAYVLGQLGRYDEADALVVTTIAKARTGLPQRVPSLLMVRGRLLAKRGDFERALPILEEAAAIEQTRSAGGFGELGELGIAQARAKKPEAEKTLREVIARAERAGGALPWEPLYHLGRIESEAGRTADALKTLERAAREIEKGEVVLDSDAAKSRYWSDKAGVYTLLVKLLLGMNRTGDALRYVERAKAAELEDLRKQAGGREAGIGLELEVAESRFAEELRAEQCKSAPDAEKMRRIDELLADVRRRRGDYIDQLDREMHKKAGSSRDVYSIPPLELEKLQEYVPEGTLVLSPIALDDKLVVFAVTHDAITHFDVDVGAAEIDRLVSAVVEETAPPGGTQRGAVPIVRTGRKLDEASLGRLREPARRLYDVLLRPAVDRFGMPKVLVVSASGGLRYLPFAALHDGTSWLMEKTALVEVTSLDQQKFAAQKASTEKLRVLAFADPDGSLPGARREVAEVRGVYADARVLDGQGATLAALREQIRAPGFDIVHLATHGRLDGAHPDQSNILLAGQPLYYKDIPGLRFARTRLVVLSACDTASRGSGVEVTGLAYQFERTNVRAVVATLWPVDDSATAKLMADFYRRLRGGAGYVEALAGAQRGLASQPQYSHPYYWAPFIVIGAP